MLDAGSGTAAREAGTKSSPPWRRKLRTALLLLGVAAILLGAGFVWFVEELPLSEVPPARRADGIVVLTGGAARINDAVDLLASGHGRRLLITGVNPTTRPGEISRLVIPPHQHWFRCCVDFDYAVNTIENAIETRRWVLNREFKSLIVVTSNFHMPRAMAELRHQLPEVTLVPFPVISDRVRVESWWSSRSTARLLFSEYLKYILAVVRTRLGIG